MDKPAKTYAHMCRDGHTQIGHNDSTQEMCPMCRALASLTDCVETLEAMDLHIDNPLYDRTRSTLESLVTE